MPSIPMTENEERRVLKTLGLQSTEDLFVSVPPKIRDAADFKIDLGEMDDHTGRGLTEHELRLYFHKLADKNAYAGKYTHFLGGGIYDNIVPAIVNQLTLRGEFLTCYTPYQPEISQGTLQYIFEFQTLICRLTGMPIANASMYDGPTATAEAVLMAQRLSAKKEESVLIAGSLSPEYKGIIQTFLCGHSKMPVEIPWKADSTLDFDALASLTTEHKPCAVVVSYPNYFGSLEDLKVIKQKLPADCLLIVAVPDPSVLALYEPPGLLGADIVTGEGHQFGTPMLFGGPHVGFFCTRKEYLRQMPGRVCGETTDSRGQRAYTLTLSTREQHIRREKATSNICTNQGLIALRTTIYLSFLGKSGFLKLGETNQSLYDYLADALEHKGVIPQFKNALCYREGVFKVPNLTQRFKKAVALNMIPGIPLSKYFKEKEFNDSLLITVNPKHTKRDLDKLVEVLSHD